MSKRSRILVMLAILIGLGSAAFWPGLWRPQAYANVTLVSFTANSQAGHPEIIIHWETATEFNTLGFFVTRSTSAVDPFARVSNFIPNQGDTITGAQYVFTDTTTILNVTYWYKLEEITTDQQSIFYGPITATAGIPATAISTPTASPTATRTPTGAPTRTPTPTPTASATAKVKPTKSGAGGSYVTPQLATGSTITPQPSVVKAVATNPAPVTTPQVFATETVPAGNIVPQPVSVINTPAQAIANGSTTGQATPVPTGRAVAGASVPPLEAAALAPAQVAPVVVVTEAGSASAADNFASAINPLVLIAVLLLLGGGLAIFLQARK